MERREVEERSGKAGEGGELNLTELETQTENKRGIGDPLGSIAHSQTPKH